MKTYKKANIKALNRATRHGHKVIIGGSSEFEDRDYPQTSGVRAKIKTPPTKAEAPKGPLYGVEPCKIPHVLNETCKTCGDTPCDI